MRIATSTSFDRATQQLNVLQSESDALLSQISGGKKLLSPADAPGESARVSSISRALAEHAQTVRNIGTAATRLTLGENALGSAGDVLDRVLEVALAVAGDAANPADRQSAAGELAQLSDQLLAAANARSPAGDWLFSGLNSKTPAFVRAATGEVTWQSVGTPSVVPLRDGRVVEASEPGNVIFAEIPSGGGVTSAFNVIDDLRAALTDVSMESGARRAILDRSIGDLERAASQIIDARARFGARLSQLDSEQNSLRTIDIELMAQRSQLEDVDVSASAVSLSRAQLLLQATRDAFARISSLSLFDSLR